MGWETQNGPDRDRPLLYSGGGSILLTAAFFRTPSFSTCFSSITTPTLPFAGTTITAANYIRKHSNNRLVPRILLGHYDVYLDIQGRERNVFSSLLQLRFMILRKNHDTCGVNTAVGYRAGDDGGSGTARSVRNAAQIRLLVRPTSPPLVRVVVEYTRIRRTCDEAFLISGFLFSILPYKVK